MLYRIKEFFSRITRPFKRSFDWLMHNNPNKRYLVLIEVVLAVLLVLSIWYAFR